MIQSLYYVYTLADPRDGAVFYVGKGKGDRIKEHEKEARRGVSSPKCNKINEILTAGLQVDERIVARFDNEQEAYAHESLLIAQFGACLTNGGRIARPDRLLAARFRYIALAIKIKAGAITEPATVWAAALFRGMQGRTDQIIASALAEFGMEKLREGVKPYGVALA